MGKRGWRRVLGISEAQRQLSRKLGIPLSGRKSRAGWFGRTPRGPRGGPVGDGSCGPACLIILAAPSLCCGGCCTLNALVAVLVPRPAETVPETSPDTLEDR